MLHDQETQRLYHHYRARELYRSADRERLAQQIVRPNRPMRFYYPALAQFGRWLIASGLRLQKRYGELRDFPATSSHPAQRNA